MVPCRYFGSANHMSAELKRTAHAVRQAVDAKPVRVDASGRTVNPRRERLVVIASAVPVAYEQPYLHPRTRHRLSWQSWRNAA